MISNIVLDMGGVLLEFDPGRILAHFCDSEADGELLHREVFRSVEWARADRGLISEADAVAAVCRRVPRRLHPTVEALYSRWNEAARVLPETNELAVRLKEAGYGLYLLSNAAASFYRYYETIPALGVFDGLFVSSDWGMVKPEGEIYRAFCAHFSLIPARCFFIDDTPLNVEAAIHTGMRGCVYHGDPEELAACLRAEGVRI